jgi:predicted  nucleic acid-binding Zn-ribbon protein
MSSPFKLFRLQQIDNQLDSQRTRLNGILASLEDDSQLQQTEAKLASAKEDLLQARNQLKNAEFETQQQRIKIEQTESALYGGKVRNPKELQDLQNEAAALKRYLSTLEGRQFETMLLEEETSARYEAANLEREAVQNQYQSNILELNQAKEKLLKDIMHSEDERNAAAASIEEQDLAYYNQLRQKRRGVAVSMVVDRACSACGSTLSAALLNAAHSPNQLNPCETCGRILYIG